MRVRHTYAGTSGREGLATTDRAHRPRNTAQNATDRWGVPRCAGSRRSVVLTQPFSYGLVSETVTKTKLRHLRQNIVVRVERLLTPRFCAIRLPASDDLGIAQLGGRPLR